MLKLIPKHLKFVLKTIKNHYLKWHQYKILTEILGIISKLHKIKIKDQAIYRQCNKQEETLIHLFTKCHKIV